MFQRINGHVAIAGALAQTDIERLAQQGYRTIIDLRTDDEPVPHGLRPVEVGECAANLNLHYQQIPITLARVDTRCINRVRGALERAETPVLLHCASGRRAGFFALIHLGCQGRWSAEKCLSHAPCIGLDLESMPAMRDLLVQ